MQDYSKPFKVAINSVGGSFDVTPDAGRIKRILLYLEGNETKNPQMVTAGVVVNGNELLKQQPIESYRSRDVAYESDGKPLVINGGSLVTVNIASRAQFTADLYGYIVFVYADEFQEPQY